MLRSFRGVSPRVAPSAYVDPGATVIGDVIIGERSSVWPSASIRGDICPIRIGEETSIQDGSVVHTDEGIPLTIGNRVTVGHLAVLHGCTIEDDALIGIGAIVLNRARIGRARWSPRERWFRKARRSRRNAGDGRSRQARRPVTEEEQERFREGVRHYAERAAEYLGRNDESGQRHAGYPAAVQRRLEPRGSGGARSFPRLQLSRNPHAHLRRDALFARGVGADTDIVSKEMYTFEDRDGSSLTLRPEATASVMRAYIEHRLDQLPGVKKLYYIGPMFRRERPQKGRYRQFYQIGAEAIGSESPLVDAEVIEMVVEHPAPRRARRISTC